MWKEILIIILSLTTIISLVYSIIKCTCNPSKYSIVIHEDVDTDGLYERITRAYITLSSINKFTSPIPITHEFSHWMVLLETEKDKHYLVSTSSKQCVEIINTNFDKYIKCCMYRYQEERYCYVKKQGFEVKNININVIDYCKKLLKHYILVGDYTFFVNNCHHMTEYGLTKILRIDEAKDYLKRSYSFRHIIADICNNNTEFKGLYTKDKFKKYHKIYT